MQNNDLISVVIPVYNVEPYIRACVESVLQQSYKNLEIILVDDGSADRCPAICDEYAEKDARIKVIHKSNGGLSDARNAGIEAATGAYITLIDSDDSIHPAMISYLYNALIQNDADISFCQRQEIDENGAALPSKSEFSTFIVDGRNTCMEEFLKNRQIDTVAWGKLYKRSMFDDVRYPFGKYHEDVFTTYKIIAKCNRMFIGEERYYNYRIRTASITQSSFSLKHLDAIEANEERAKFIEKNYPQLKRYANAGIIYAVNQCALRLAKSKPQESIHTKQLIRNFQTYYRRYEKDFLHGSSSRAAKLFSLAAYINLPMVFWFLKKR